jgi:citrate synthase
MKDHIKAIMAGVWGVAPDSIPDNAELNTFTPWDSMGHISLLLALEAEYGIEVNETSIASLLCLEDIVAACQARNSFTQ